MIETIVDLKNNKRKLGAAGQNDDLERLRKFLMNMVKKRLAVGSEPLRFGLKDLREADKKGS
jgi:nucleolar MIF4G domain-containing protein 1